MTKMAPSTLCIVLMLLIASTYSTRIKRNQKAELEEYIAEKQKELNPRYRLHYHIAGPVGWINDPNGFSFFKGQFHLFYQFYPYDSVWGPMHWGHVVSPDLVHWEQLPTALLPDEEYCFSGSAVEDNGKLVLMYTAHIETNNVVNQSQYLAFSDDGIEFTKYEGNPVLPAAPNGSPDFRDPKVWRHDDYWYSVIGVKTDDHRGQVILYRSIDLLDWTYLSVIGESNGDVGYMWECPDFFEIDGRYILLISPQGMEPVGDRYKSVHQTGYIIGSFNYTTFEFIPETEFEELDYGHDFYAAQTTDEGGKRYITAWFNMWDVPHYESEDGWAGALTLIRELKLHGNRLLMKPVEAMVSIRDGTLIEGDLSPDQRVDLGRAVEVIIEGNLDQNIELVLEGKDGTGKVWIRWDSTAKKVAVDRESDDDRQVEWSPIGSRSWRLFLDASSLELFCGEGEVVFSSRAFPDGGWSLTNLSPQVLKVEAYKLKQSVPGVVANSSISMRGLSALFLISALLSALGIFDAIFKC